MFQRLILSFVLAAAYCTAFAVGNTPDGLHAGESKPEIFAWGASLRTSVDMSQHDMSTIGMEAYGGIRSGVISVLGIGMAYNTAVSSGARQLPIYLIARSGFSSRPTLCFAEVQSGLSVNYDDGDTRHTGAYFSAGLGFNLASSKNFSSHLVVGYMFNGACATSHDAETDAVTTADVHSVSVRLGITF